MKSACRTAQRYERELNLPVRRLAGEKGRAVVASVDALTEWKQRVAAVRWWQNPVFLKRYAVASTALGQLTLSATAPPEGVEILISASSTAARPPASVRIGPGLRAASFAIPTNVVASTQAVTITAALNGVQRTATLNILGSTPLSIFESYEIRVEGTMTLSGRQVPFSALVSGPNILPMATVDTTRGVVASGIILYVFFENPAYSGNSVTFSRVNGQGTYSNISSGAVLQTVISGRFTISANSPNVGTSVSGTLQFATANQSFSTTFSGSIVSSQRVR